MKKTNAVSAPSGSKKVSVRRGKGGVAVQAGVRAGVSMAQPVQDWIKASF